MTPIFLDKKTKTSNKMLLFGIVLFGFICLISNFQSAQAQQYDTRILTITENYESYFLSPYIIQYNDIENAYSAKDILTQTNLRADITEVTGSITVLGNNGNIKWFVLDIINKSDQTTWSMDFGNNFNGRFGLLDELEIYTFNETSRILSKNNTSKESSIRLKLEKDQKLKILLKIKSRKGLTTTFPIKLVHPYVYQPAQQKLSFFITAALLTAAGFFFAAIAFIQRKYNYLYITLYYFSFILYLLVQNLGVTSSFPIFGSAIIPLTLFSITSAGYLIARIFWDIEDTSYLWDRLFYAPIVIGFISILLADIIPTASPIVKMSLFYGPIVLLLSVLSFGSILKSHNSGTEISAFMFGWFIMLFGVSISVLSLSGTMQPISSAINAYWFTLIPQAFFLAMASYFKLSRYDNNVVMSKTLEINENDTVSRLKKSVENTEQERLLKVIEQERKILGELRKSEARRTEEMRHAKEEADQANKAKSSFLAVVTHEIRTPMTGIMGMVRMLLDSNLSKDQKEYAQIIQDSSDSMLALLNDILDFEKIEQGKMTFENINFDLSRLIQGVARLMNGHAAQKNIDLITKIGEDIPKYVKGDPNRLRQVLLNLTGNAVKFTSEGHVVISCELIEIDRKNKTYEIYFGVTDSGIGISKEAQKHLFNPFSQADESISRKFGGTGLGLAISNGLVQSMGSAININSQEDQGSTFFFTVTLPEGTGSDIETSEEQDNEQLVTKTINPINILIVDDNETNRKVIRGFLNKQNHTLHDASNAQEAFDVIKENSIDLVFMDIEMPGISGDEATKQLRQSQDPSKRDIPVIAITGNVMPDHIVRYENAGMNGYLAKPIDPKKLHEITFQASQGHFSNNHNFVATLPPNQDTQEIEFVDNITQVADESETTSEESVFAEPEHENITKIEDNAGFSLEGQPDTESYVKLENDLTEDLEDKEKDAPEKIIEENTNIFNPETINSLINHISIDEIHQMLKDVIEKTEEIIASMNEALATDDQKILSSKGHELKGMAGNFGLNEISRQAAEIEARAKDSAILVLTSLIEPLPAMQNNAEEAIESWLHKARNS